MLIAIIDGPNDKWSIALIPNNDAMNAPSNPLYFLIAFPLLWFAVTIILSFLSGWFGLMERYPNRAETPVVTLANQSGSLGFVSMRGV